jgi:hypothetical protein
MNLVSTIVLPANGRLKFDPDGSEDVLGAFAVLPIPMPRTVTVWAGADGRPAAMWADDQRIKPADFAPMWVGITEFNNDCRNQGTEPSEVTESTVREEWDGEDEE